MRCLIGIAISAMLIATLGCGLPQSPTTASSDSSGSPSNNNTQGTMAAAIANFPWSANGRVTATYSPSQNGLGASILTLTGQDFPLTEMLSFTVSSVTLGSVLTPGTFSVATPGNNANLMDSNGTTYQASGLNGSGTVTLSTFSTATRTATGSFSFVMLQSTGTTTKAVTTGSFSVTF